MAGLTFEVSGTPVGKQRPRVVRGRNGGVHTYTPKNTVAYERLIAVEAIAAGARRGKLPPPYALEVLIWWPDRRRRDADNVLKAVGDALNGVVWEDDSQVTRTVTEVMGIDKDAPRICVTVEGRGE